MTLFIGMDTSSRVLKNHRSPFESLRANGKDSVIVEHFPFVLSPSTLLRTGQSKHSQAFFNDLLKLIKIVKKKSRRFWPKAINRSIVIVFVIVKKLLQIAVDGLKAHGSRTENCSRLQTINL